MSHFYQLVREAVHLDWDPIGIGGPFALKIGEYDHYIPGICAFLRCGPTESEVFDYLWSIETEAIGLQGTRERTLRFAMYLIRLEIT